MEGEVGTSSVLRELSNYWLGRMALYVVAATETWTLNRGTPKIYGQAWRAIDFVNSKLTC